MEIRFIKTSSRRIQSSAKPRENRILVNPTLFWSSVQIFREIDEREEYSLWIFPIFFVKTHNTRGAFFKKFCGTQQIANPRCQRRSRESLSLEGRQQMPNERPGKWNNRFTTNERSCVLTPSIFLLQIWHFLVMVTNKDQFPLFQCWQTEIQRCST